jgi:hypothetical protein
MVEAQSIKTIPADALAHYWGPHGNIGASDVGRHGSIRRGHDGGQAAARPRSASASARREVCGSEIPCRGARPSPWPGNCIDGTWVIGPSGPSASALRSLRLGGLGLVLGRPLLGYGRKSLFLARNALDSYGIDGDGIDARKETLGSHSARLSVLWPSALRKSAACAVSDRRWPSNGPLAHKAWLSAP